MNQRKYQLVYIILPVLILVCVYQLYWLIGQYNELKQRLEEDIQEVLRSSDFEELVHRVDVISKMDYKGRIDVNMGYDHKQKNTVVQSELNENPKKEESKSGTQTVVSPDSFGSILRTPEDLMKMGLNMQRGIHSSLDGIQEVDLDYLDMLISDKLDSIGIGSDHMLLYLQHGKVEDASRTDTLATYGNIESLSSDTFSLELPGDAEYKMIIPQWHTAVLVKMMPIIVFSFITFIILIVSFWYLIRMMRRQKELEDIKTDFTNNITHELKTPIAVAYAANDALLNFGSSQNTPRMIRYLGVCQEQLRLLDRLVEQILSLSMERRQTLILNMEVVEIEELLLALADNFRMKYSQSVQFKIEVEKNLKLVCDRMHLSNIIGNLIDNAVKYSQEIAEVTLTARNDRDGVVIKVIDKGIGMTTEQTKRIFEKYYRVPHGNLHDVKGYGLGLFYVKSMTEKLGGTVSVKSTYGKGSCFMLKFSNQKENGENQSIAG